MARSLFDPLKTAAAQSAAQSEQADAPITVSQLAQRIDQSLRAGIPQGVRFTGEVTGFRDNTHWYFSLKDASAVVNCVMFQSAARRLRFTPANGQQVIAKGRVEYYAPQGRVSVILDSLEPVGAGALEIAFRALCDELRQLGWFAEERKRPLPAFPRKIAVVTSRSAAALQDVLVTMRKRCPAVSVLLADCRVQGQGAAEEVAQAVRHLGANAKALGVDAIIVTRGGGSMEDLWAFNERVVAEAIVQCPIPVVAAIGHETDTTIAELVADVRAATPTQAAMRLTPDATALMQQVDSTASRLANTMRRIITTSRRELESLATRPLFASPRRSLDAYGTALAHQASRLSGASRALVMNRRSAVGQIEVRLERCRPAAVFAARGVRLETISSRLATAMRHRLQRQATSLDSLSRQLTSVSPLRVLERGYSVTMTADGTLVRSIADVAPGSRIVTRVSDGSISSTVQSDRNANAAKAGDEPSAGATSDSVSSPTPSRRGGGKRTSPQADASGPNLFS